MKKIILTIIIIALALLVGFNIAKGQISGGSGGGISGAQFWKLVGTTLTPIVSSWSVQGGAFFTGSTGTATSTPLAKGDLIVAASSTAWRNLAVGANGKVLTASSTAPLGISWETASAGASVAGSDTQIQFNNSGSLGATSSLTYTSSTGVLYLNGQVSSSLGLFNRATTTDLFSTNAIFTTATTTNLSVGTLTGMLRGSSGVVSVASGGSDYELPLTFGDGLTRTSNDVDCDTANGSTFGCLSSTDWNTFNNKLSTAVQSVASSTSVYASAATGSNISFKSKQDIQWSSSYTTSTQSWFDPIYAFDATSTIQSVYVNSSSTSNRLTWNLYYGATNTPKTGMYKLFSSAQTTTSTPSAVKLTPNASSTPCYGCSLWLDQSNASSTLTTFTIYYNED